jgi:hypothetical protein
MVPDMRFRLVVLAIAGALAVMAPPTSAASKGTTRTEVAGAWQATPGTGIFTAGDPQSCRFTYQGVVTLNGAFNGVFHEIDGKAQCDLSKFPRSLPYHLTTGGTIDAVYFGDGSRGSFTFKGVGTGEGVSGQFFGDYDITSSSGDPTWRCTTLHLSFDGIANPFTSFGGYRGTWIHGCKS